MNATCKVSKRGMFFFYALAASLFTGCGGGGGGGGGTPPLQAPIGNVAGVWTITELSQTSPSPECEPPADPLPAPYPLTITQSGNNLTVFDGTTTFTGTISADTITWSGSFPEGAGTTTLNSLSVTVQPSCNTLSGNSTWTYVEAGPPAFQCTGAGAFSGTRNVADGCVGPTINEIEPNGSFAESQVVTFPANISGTNVDGDADAFSFTLASAQTVTITLDGGTVTDMDLFLYNASTTPIGQSIGLTSQETITMALAAGTYYVAVLPFDVTTTTSYTLSIQ